MELTARSPCPGRERLRKAVLDGQASQGGWRYSAGRRGPSRTVIPFYAADPDAVLAVARHPDVSPADSAAMADGLKPLAISQTARTISCRKMGSARTTWVVEIGSIDTEHDEEAGQHERRDGHKAPGRQPSRDESRLIEHPVVHERPEAKGQHRHFAQRITCCHQQRSQGPGRPMKPQLQRSQIPGSRSPAAAGRRRCRYRALPR